jgi:hypothetical protein
MPLNRRTQGAQVLALVFTLVGLVAGPASAQEAAPKRETRGRSPARVVLKDTRIDGRVQKPQAFYILSRSNLNFEGLQLKTSFVPKIIQSVEQPPF